jgi:hypothetical protein
MRLDQTSRPEKNRKRVEKRRSDLRMMKHEEEKRK